MQVAYIVKLQLIRLGVNSWPIYRDKALVSELNALLAGPLH